MIQGIPSTIIGTGVLHDLTDGVDVTGQRIEFDERTGQPNHNVPIGTYKLYESYFGVHT